MAEIIPTCARCGFLSLLTDLGELGHATAPYREKGHEDSGIRATHFRSDWPVCFVQAARLREELASEPNPPDDGPAGANRLRVLQRERPDCVGKYTEWIQGFTPKEHREMLDREESQRLQRRQDRFNLRVALTGVIVAVIGIAVSGWLNLQAAHVQADAQRDSARIQVEAMKELADRPTTAPTINVLPAPVPVPTVTIVMPSTSPSVPDTPASPP